MYDSEKTIDELVTMITGAHTDPREKHLFRESLRNLVRLAKAEQMQEMRMDVVRATGHIKARASMFVSPE